MLKNRLKTTFYSLILGISLPAVAQTASFSSLDGTQIKALVFHPAASSNGQTSRGTVVALHGCGGLYATVGSRKGQLNARHQAMADLLVTEGYNVVFPDSLTPRGENELCTQKIGTRKIDQTERRADVLGTLAWVATQPWAQPGRIALLGWSHGGSAVLSSTDATRADVRGQAVKPAVAVAFYPGCAAALKSGYKPSTPLVLMLGEKDDWTPPGPCIALGQAVGAEVNVYADSYHDFDSPVGQLRVRTDVPNGVNPGQGVHVGPNPVAREKAYLRLKGVFGKALNP
jgi:dienelactone hydrolase